MGLRAARATRLVRAAAAGAALLLSAGAAQAASCSALKSELARLDAAPASGKWASAKTAQSNAITAAERDARYFGCASTPTAKCSALNGKIKRMRANLAAIERQLRKSGGGTAAKAKQVRAALARQKCDAPAREAARPAKTDGDKPRNFFARLFSAQSRLEPVSARSGDREIAAVNRQTRGTSASTRRLPAGGTFRTLCVRTCDGYFFPVSFSTGKSQFANDEARCSEICPAAPTELYVYRNPGGDQEAMMSLAGDLYAEQPFAYRYKSEFVAGCSCRATGQSRGPSRWTELDASSKPGAGPSSGDRVFFADISAGLPRHSRPPSRGGTFEAAKDIPSPLARTPLARAHLPRHLDPDTLMNMEKGFDVRVDLAQVTARVAAPEPAVTALRDGLPTLSVRGDSGVQGPDIAVFAPVFGASDDGYRPAEAHKTPVRVVGPQYYVAQ